MSYFGLLSAEVSISRRFGPRDALGHSPETFAFVANTTALIQVPKEKSSRAVDGNRDFPTAKGFFKNDVDIRVSDRVTTASGRVWRISAVVDAAGQGHHVEVLLVEVPL